MTFEQLIYFTSIVENHTYFNAAHILNISQSSLSKQIIKLEKELDIELFDRKYRSATLTETGKIFYYDALELIKQYKVTLKHLENYKISKENTLHIGVLPFQAQYNLTSVFKEFENEYPEINLIISEVEENSLLNGINQNTYDLIITRENMINKDYFNIYPIAEDELVAVVNSVHKLSRYEKLTLDQLSHENFILMNSYTSIYKLCLDKINKYKIVANIVNTARVESIIGSVSINKGISLLPKSNFNIFNCKDISIIPFDPPIKLSIVVAKNKTREITPALKKFINFLDKT